MVTTRKSQCEKLLTAYRRYPQGLTDAEAARKARLHDQPGVCWWHRSSDLRKTGKIEWVLTPTGEKVTRAGEFDVPVGVSVITTKGLAR